MMLLILIWDGFLIMAEGLGLDRQCRDDHRLPDAARAGPDLNSITATLREEDPQRGR